MNRGEPRAAAAADGGGCGCGCSSLLPSCSERFVYLRVVNERCPPSRYAARASRYTCYCTIVII
jgi:hypothetical protein